MTNQFDALLEQILSEAPVDIGELGFGGATERILSRIPKGEPKGHNAPLQKLSPEDQKKAVEEILKHVFEENDNTYNPIVDDEKELKLALQLAIKKVSKGGLLKAAAEYSSKFLADRLFTSLKDKIKYTTTGGEELQKDMTQKEFKQALNKALEAKPAEQDAEEKEETESEPPSEEVEMIYVKAADSNSENPDVQKAFNKLPNDKEMSYKEVISSIKTSTPGEAFGLFDKLLAAGALIAEPKKETEASEDQEVADLDFDEEGEAEGMGYDSEYQRMMRDLGGVSTSRQFGGSMD